MRPATRNRVCLHRVNEHALNQTSSTVPDTMQILNESFARALEFHLLKEIGAIIRPKQLETSGTRPSHRFEKVIFLRVLFGDNINVFLCALFGKRKA